MLDDVAAAMQRSEHINETEHLHLEMFVPHRERHHPLIETGFAEKRFGISIDELKNTLAAAFRFKLERTHCAMITPGLDSAKSDRAGEFYSKHAQRTLPDSNLKVTARENIE